MNLIKITGVPPGEAPLSIRKEWVEILLPVDVKAPAMWRAGVLSGKFQGESKDDYPVKAGVAIELLRRKSSQAAEWWDNVKYDYHSWFLFPKSVCKEMISFPDLSSVERNIVSIMEAHFIEGIPVNLLMQANHLLFAWMYHHKLSDKFNSLEDRQLLEAFWGLCSRYFIDLTEDEKVQVMQHYLDD